MNTVKTGIDGMNLTFSPDIPLYEILEMFRPSIGMSGTDLSTYFTDASPARFYRKGSAFAPPLSYPTPVGFVHEPQQTKRTYLKFSWGSLSEKGQRNLLQIKGMCFADSALNPFRPLDLGHLITTAVQLGAVVSSMDPYIDDFHGFTTQKHLNEISQPHVFDNFIQSPFMKADKNGLRPEPRYFKGTWYYGVFEDYFNEGTGEKHNIYSNSCEIQTYNKRLSPRQKIWTADNALKHLWQRYELHLVKDTSKNIGAEFFTAMMSGQNMNTFITDVFREYLRFVNPGAPSRPSGWKLQSWYEKMLAAADNLPPVILTESVF